MILTGLAKDDFLSWYGTGEHYFVTTLKPIEQYANIVEWLDGVGIYVNVSPRYVDHTLKYSTGDFYAVINFKDFRSTVASCNYNGIEDKIYSRQQATEAAIKLADKIYNNRQQ